MKCKLILYLSLIILIEAQAQPEIYNFRREISGVEDPWHRITLPDQIFGNLQTSCQDVRIFGIKEHLDTVEVPYFLKIYEEHVNQNERSFHMLNNASGKDGYYFTFEMKGNEAINQILLQFAQDNFDWQVGLEGSQDQTTWFRLLENYRILSIKNKQTSYQFTKLNFPVARYRYFKIHIKSQEKPQLTEARILEFKTDSGRYKNYIIKSISKINDRKNRTSEIIADLEYPVPVSYIGIRLKDTIDYLRPIHISYLSDSTKTEHGWLHNYNNLTEDTLHSRENYDFKCTSTRMQRIKITIDNQDNLPLQIDSIIIKGFVHEIIARFTEPMKYYLYYGSSDAKTPYYDIDRFMDKVPKDMKGLTLGEEQIIGNSLQTIPEPLFKNKIWLWLIIAIIILVLGWFSLQMIKNKS